MHLLVTVWFSYKPLYQMYYQGLVYITENIRKALDNKNYACGVFVDLQKAFDTVNHNILLKKLDHYGNRGTVNDWFASYLSNRSQFVSILGFD